MKVADMPAKSAKADRSASIIQFLKIIYSSVPKIFFDLAMMGRVEWFFLLSIMMTKNLALFDR